MNTLRLSLLQIDIDWENKKANLQKLKTYLKDLQGKTDLVVLPEMFTTGFTMNSHLLAEDIQGDTIQQLQKWSKEFDLALCGSFICTDQKHYYNRGFFITPQQENFFYDKRHLFRMGDESHYFSSGNQRCVIPYKGWNILLTICYDIRFPVWLRNINNEYDLLITVANWPEPRNKVWEALLCARAIENQCYVCGVNRVGIDGNGLKYTGKSTLLDAKGDYLSHFIDNTEMAETITIDLESLQKFRNKFPVWKDSDRFEILTDSN